MITKKRKYHYTGFICAGLLHQAPSPNYSLYYLYFSANPPHKHLTYWALDSVTCNCPDEQYSAETMVVQYTVFQKKTPTHIIGYTLRNSCLILIIFDTRNSSHNSTSHDSLVVHLS